MRELLELFQKNKLTERHIVEAMLTDLGGGLYCYMVMLTGAEREAEAERMERLRGRIFKIRNVINGFSQTDEEKKMDPVREMEKVSLELQVLYDLLRIYRPAESVIFQTPVNDAIGLVWTIKEYVEKAPV